MILFGLFCGQNWWVYIYTLYTHMHKFTSCSLLYVSVYIWKTMGLHPYLQLQFNTAGFTVVFSHFLYWTLFFNSENPGSIFLNAFSYWSFLVPVTYLLWDCPPSLCKDHLFTLLGLSSPTRPCHCQPTIPHGYPPQPAQTLTHLSDHCSSLCLDVLLTLLGLQYLRWGCSYCPSDA